MEDEKNNHAIKILIAVIIVLIIGIVLGAVLFVRTAEKNRAAEEEAQPIQQTAPADQTQPSEQHSPAVQKTRALITLPEGLEIPLCPGTRALATGKTSPSAATAQNAADSDHQVRHFSSFTICYRETYEEAEWAAYKLDKSELTGEVSRTNDFRPDPMIATGSATLNDYRGSGYDRGHLAPAADFSFSPNAMSESFYLSNMTPQAPSFNRGIWKELESLVRDWAEQFGRVYVVCGPVLDSPASSFASIGADKVAIPRLFYKVILAPVYKDADDASTPDNAAKIIAVGFIIPNKGCDGSVWDFAVSVDSAEERTGLDFYALLDDTAENTVESSYNRANW